MFCSMSMTVISCLSSRPGMTSVPTTQTHTVLICYRHGDRLSMGHQQCLGSELVGSDKSDNIIPLLARTDKTDKGRRILCGVTQLPEGNADDSSLILVGLLFWGT